MSEILAELRTVALGVTALSFALCLCIIGLKRRVPRLNGRVGDLSAVQSAHSRLTPRIGGLAIFGAFALGLILWPIPFALGAFGFILAGCLTFAVGLAEDLGFAVSPRGRLFSACCASLLAIWMFGGWLPRTDIPGLDLVLDHAVFGIPLTLLLTVGISNGFNLIDGVNGLAGLAGIAASVALAMIAAKTGNAPIMSLALLLAAGLLGFVVLNFPCGFIFLGDAGAYTIGFVLSWLGIAVIAFSPAVTPWAVLLTMLWPTVDTLIAIYRRVRRKGDALAPDRLHMHQMVMRALEICWVGRESRHITNPMTTVIMAPFVIAPPVVGVLLWDQSLPAFAAVMGFCAFCGSGVSIIRRISLRFRRTRARAAPAAYPAPRRTQQST